MIRYCHTCDLPLKDKDKVVYALVAENIEIPSSRVFKISNPYGIIRSDHVECVMDPEDIAYMFEEPNND